MTEPRSLPAPGEQPAASAAAIVAGRIFLLDNPRYADHVPPFLAASRSGLALSGKGSNARACALWGRSGGVLLADPGAYLDQVATEDAPFALPDSDGALFGGDLDTVLDGQRNSHAAVAMTPSLYIQAGDSPAFKALVRHAQAIERDDVIVVIAVALPWLTQTQYLGQLIAGLQRIRHPRPSCSVPRRTPSTLRAPSRTSASCWQRRQAWGCGGPMYRLLSTASPTAAPSLPSAQAARCGTWFLPMRSLTRTIPQRTRLLSCCRRCFGTAWDGSSRTSTRTPRLRAASASSAGGHRWIASTASTATCVPSPMPTTPQYGPAGCPTCSATLLPQMGRYGGVIVACGPLHRPIMTKPRSVRKDRFPTFPAIPTRGRVLRGRPRGLPFTGMEPQPRRRADSGDADRDPEPRWRPRSAQRRAGPGRGHRGGRRTRRGGAARAGRSARARAHRGGRPRRRQPRAGGRGGGRGDHPRLPRTGRGGQERGRVGGRRHLRRGRARARRGRGARPTRRRCRRRTSRPSR